jgi:hypothetical protein
MQKMSKYGIWVVVGLLIVSNIIGWVRIGRGGSEMKMLEREWAVRDSVYMSELDEVRGAWTELDKSVSVWKGRMDSLEGIWWKASKEVKGLEDWFKKRSR